MYQVSEGMALQASAGCDAGGLDDGRSGAFFLARGEARHYRLAHPLRVCTRLVRNGLTGQYGV